MNSKYIYPNSNSSIFLETDCSRYFDNTDVNSQSKWNSVIACFTEVKSIALW